MLNRLLPEQISNFWNIIKYAIEESLPPTIGEHSDKMNRILSSALAGNIDVWASYEHGETNRFEGIVVTQFLIDEPSNTKSLLIYCLYGYEQVNKASWLQGLNAIAEYAKANGCSKVIGYTSSPYIVKIAKSLGADTNYTFISFSL